MDATMLRFALLVSFVVMQGTALADSDGYFCAGKGYLAYETQYSWPTKGHYLRVVRIRLGSGISESTPILLEPFQTHGMRCGESQVELLGWDFRYVVDVSADPPRLADKIRVPKPGATLAGFVSMNLAHWSQPGVLELMSDDHISLYELVITKAQKPVKNGIEHYTITEVTQRPRTGYDSIQASLRLFCGVSESGGD